MVPNYGTKVPNYVSIDPAMTQLCPLAIRSRERPQASPMNPFRKNPHRNRFALAFLLVPVFGCEVKNAQQPPSGLEVEMPGALGKERHVDEPNSLGFSKIRIREGELYKEGVVDRNGREIVQSSENLLIDDITENFALVRYGRKFLFVPLDQGFVSAEDMEAVNGFQYAEPYRCGLAMVSVDDVRFYIDGSGQKAFDSVFEFAESFHYDRALVRADNRFRIIDTSGQTIAELKYDQVNLQSPWCWQVTNKENQIYYSGFVDLNGKEITELIYEDVGYYDPEVKRIRVGLRKRFGFLDENAKVVIPLQYEYAEPFDRGKAKVSLNGRAFFINPDGVELEE